MDIDILKTEIDTDPLVRGYDGMTDAEVVTSMNTVDRTTNKESLTGSEVMNAIDKAEFTALSATNKAMVWNIVHIGIVNPFGIEADLMIDLFGGGSTTITTLAALRLNNVTRGEELGIGRVREGNVQEARR